MAQRLAKNANYSAYSDLCRWKVNCRLCAGVVGWFKTRLFVRYSYVSNVFCRIRDWHLAASSLTFWQWHISLLGESFPFVLGIRVPLPLSSLGYPAAVKQWMTTESAHHKENYRGLCTKAKTWTQPDSAIHVISFLLQVKSKTELWTHAVRTTALLPLLLCSGRPIKICIIFSWQGGTQIVHNPKPLLTPEGDKITLIISLQPFAFSDVRQCENLSDILTVNTNKCDGINCARHTALEAASW